MTTQTKSSEKHNTSEGDKDHLEFEATIFYNFIFDLGQIINPTIAARKLLETDFAIASANYLNEDIEIADRFKHLMNIRSNIEFVNSLKKGDRVKSIKWIIKHPLQFLNIVYHVLASYIRFRVRAKEDDREQSKETLEDILRSIDEAMITIQLFAALHRDVDRSLFTPQYLGEIPFSRVYLQPVFVTFSGESFGIDVEILIHRTGIAILTFYIQFRENKQTEELTKFGAYASCIDCFRICESILKANPQSFAEPTERRYSSGINWSIYEGLDDYKLVNIFKLYQGAIISAIQKKKFEIKTSKSSFSERSSTTLAFPIIFIDRIIPGITYDKEFKERFPKDLGALALRIPKSKSLKKETINRVIRDDLSLDEDYSLYIYSGHALCIYYERVRQALIAVVGEKIPAQNLLNRHFNTSIIIDTILIQRWILNVLNDQISSLPANLKQLNKLKREILLGLEEFHNVTLTHGETQEIIRRTRGKAGIDELYQNIIQKIHYVDSLISAEETDRRAKRDLLVKFASLFAALIFGLAGSSQVIEIIIGWGDLIPSINVEWMKTALLMIVPIIQMHSIAATLTLYFTLVGSVLLLFIWSFIPSADNRLIIHKDQSKPARISGLKWPSRIKVIHYNSKHKKP